MQSQSRFPSGFVHNTWDLTGQIKLENNLFFSLHVTFAIENHSTISINKLSHRQRNTHRYNNMAMQTTIMNLETVE